MSEVPILYQDQDLAVVVKPPGLVVNRAQTVTEPTLQDWWGEYLSQHQGAVLDPHVWQSLVPSGFQVEFGTPEAIFIERGGIVHRLDKETSGVMVLAKNPGALVNLLSQFKQRQVSKVYTCLVHGKFQVQEDTLSLPLSRSEFNRTKFTVETEGRVAETHYQVQQYYPGIKSEQLISYLAGQSIETRTLRKKIARSYQGFSLVKCWPKTGRTHQIRVHMAHVKHPIVADETYLGKKRANLDVLWCPRLFLHATELSFTHPRTQAVMQFTAPLPSDLHAALSYLQEA